MKSYTNFIVSKTNLIHNIELIKSNLKNNVKLCAVVKANAYGHNIKKLAPIMEPKVDFFAVAMVCEAVELRLIVREKPILILGKVDITQVKKCLKKNISIQLDNIELAQKIEKLKLNGKINVHLKINTGMNRFGVSNYIQFKKLINFVVNSKNINLEGIFTHFATKLDNKKFINIQYSKFKKYVKYAKKINSNIIAHCANSCATINICSMQMDMVRCGYALYNKMNNSPIKLENVLSIKSKIVNIIKIKKGESVGYDRSFIAKEKTVVAVVPIGYADGFDRRLSNNFKVLINGSFCNVVGRVCMDVFMVDITKKPNIKLFDEVTLLGLDNYGNEISLIDYANALGTSTYEILLKFNYKRMNYILK